MAIASIGFGLSLPVCAFVSYWSIEDPAGGCQTFPGNSCHGLDYLETSFEFGPITARGPKTDLKEKQRSEETVIIMNDTSTIKVGILGFGTVGQGTWKHLEENADFWEKILGVRLVPSRASVRTLDKDRKVKIPTDLLTTDSQSIVDDPEIDLLCELIGGIEEAKRLTLRAFSLGKSVVTANKALICEHGEELFQAAEAAGVHYAFEASVAGRYSNH